MPAASRHESPRPASRATIKANRVRRNTQVVVAASPVLSGGTAVRRRGQSSASRQKASSTKLLGLTLEDNYPDTSALFKSPLPTPGASVSPFKMGRQQPAEFSHPILQSAADGNTPGHTHAHATDSQHNALCPLLFQPPSTHQPAATSRSLSSKSSSSSPKSSLPPLKDIVEFVMRVHRLDPYHLKLVWIYGGNSWASHSRALSWVERYTKETHRLPMDVTLKNEGRSKGGVQSVRCTVEGCNRTFSEVQSAAEHIVSKHIGAVKWRCTFPGCQKEYNHSYDLKRHHQTKHGVTMPQRGRRRHDIPMIAASDIEFDTSSSFMSSPSTLANSPARCSVLITPKSDSHFLKSPQSTTLEEQHSTAQLLSSEHPEQLHRNFFATDGLAHTGAFSGLEPFGGACLPFRNFEMSFPSAFDGTSFTGLKDMTSLIVPNRGRPPISQCTACGCARSCHQATFLPRIASKLTFTDSLESPQPLAHNPVTKRDHVQSPSTQEMARQYLRTLPPSSTYNPSTDFMGVNSQILTQSELSSELQTLFSPLHQPENSWPLAPDTLFPSQPHQFSEQDSSLLFTLGSRDPESFGTSLPQNSNEISWLN